MSDVLNGIRVNLPDWRFVSAFVAACRAAAEESGLDANDLGTIADWKRHWDDASSGLIDARFPGHWHHSFAGQPADPPPSQEHATTAGTGDYHAGAADAAADIAGSVAHADPPAWWAIPPRLPDFTGREAWLTRLRGALTSPDSANAVVIQGLCGIGKTQLAVEYAHRYSRDYDLAWWIPCADQDSMHVALSGLQARLGLPGAPRAEGEARYASLLDRLREGKPHERWLLVFDNANEPDVIRPLIRPMGGSGHVLVTSRNSRWEASADMHELDAFTREESISFLRGRLRRFKAAEAHQLAEAVGDLPLVLEHAAEFQIAAADYVARLANDPLALLDSQPSDYPATIASEWLAAITRLQEHAPDALDLLRCLSYFGNEPIPRQALERGSYRMDVSLHALLRDSIRRNKAIMMLRRAGLLRVRADPPTLEVDRVTRWIVRAMEAAHAERSRHDVHLLMAAADTLRPDDPCDCRAYEELRAHASQSDAAACPEESVRRLVVNLARSLTSAGDPRAAVSLADSALPRWKQDEAEGLAKDSGGFLAMSQAKAEALLSCGQYQAAFRLGEDTLALMRADPARWEGEIIQLGRMAGARWRVRGDFGAALAADRDSATGHGDEFGRHTPHTFAAMNDVISDLSLNGQYSEAIAAARQLADDCLNFYNDAGYPAVLFGRNVLGRSSWLTGRYDDAVRILAQVQDGYATLAENGVLADDHPWRLTHEIDYAAARRDTGLIAADLEALASHVHDVRRRCWRTFGVDHPQTLAATVVLASILRRIEGRAAEAPRLLAGALPRYQAVLPGHPLTLACRGYLALLRWQATASEPERSALSPIPELTDVLATLKDAAGESHPLSLTARASLASALAEAGDLDMALDHAGHAVSGLKARLVQDHPHVLACEANLAAIHARRGGQQGSLVYLDFTPIPL